jgi:predicted DNA-binding protein
MIMRKRSTAIPTNIELDPAIEARFDQLVHSSGRSSAFFLQELIPQGMDDLDDIYFAGQEVERLQRGESSARPLDAVSADLGLTPRGNGFIRLPLGPGPCAAFLAPLNPDTLQPVAE